MQRGISVDERQVEDVSRLSHHHALSCPVMLSRNRLPLRKEYAALRDLAGYQAAERSDRLGFSGVVLEGLCADPKRIQPWPK